MAIQIKNLIEKRDEISVVQWSGRWEDAYDFAALWPAAKGFEVSGDAIFIRFGETFGDIILPRGTYVQIKTDVFSGAVTNDRILDTSELEKWQVKE